ncbi:MAG TPA: ice-binding family protein [Nitrososphaerales archaeon]|nr:ice-binding family protein [Nitrososphaerales archaeon]
MILSKSGISATGTTSITGNIGVSPAAGTYITGFGLALDPSGTFATSSLVTGKVYAADYAAPTPVTLTTAVGDMQTAYTDAAGRTNPTATELGAGDISGMTLAPGLYKWGTGVTIRTGVTLNCQGNSNAVFIFQIAQGLTVGNGAIVTLSGGCNANSIFWQVAGQATLGTTSSFQGSILCQTAIVLNTGATLNGRALAQTAVTLDSSAVTAP